MRDQGPVPTVVVLLFVALLYDCAAKPDEAVGTLRLTIHDGGTGKITPARLELWADDGERIVPADALEIISDCGRLPVHNWFPAVAQLQTWFGREREVRNPYTGTRQFYSAGSSVVELRPGRYRVTATKGLEYRISRVDLTISPGVAHEILLTVDPWIDLGAQGWFSADDHLHIPRAHPRFDAALARWMQAEDLDVANLLQMGLAQDVHITPQHDFGPGSLYRDGDTLLVSGQENPRTHVLGHSIVLGARRWIDFPSTYLLYDRFWQEARQQGGMNGYAHWALAAAEEGLAVWGHTRLIDFIEVLNLGVPFYQRWYETLDLGLRISPTAGTDYPCLPSLPGRERFYAQVDGPLELEPWLDAIRRGRTFVTNGPLPELWVEGKTVGADVRLGAPGSVRIQGSVRFDPDRDAVERLELVQGGVVALRIDGATGPGEVRFETSVDVAQSTWFALRASGEKRNETQIDARALFRSLLLLERDSNEELVASAPAGPIARPSAAHTAAIWVTVEGTPAIGEQPRARAVEDAWLARLDELQERFEDDRLAALAGFPGRGDGVSEETLVANRQALLDAIEAARRYYSSSTR